MRARGWNHAFHAAHGNTLNKLLFLLVVMLVLTVAGAECTKLPSFEQLEEEQHATCFPVTAPTAGSRAATAASGGAAEREDNASMLCQSTVRSEAKKRMKLEADPAGATVASATVEGTGRWPFTGRATARLPA